MGATTNKYKKNDRNCCKYSKYVISTIFALLCLMYSSSIGAYASRHIQDIDEIGANVKQYSYKSKDIRNTGLSIMALEKKIHPVREIGYVSELNYEVFVRAIFGVPADFDMIDSLAITINHIKLNPEDSSITVELEQKSMEELTYVIGMIINTAPVNKNQAQSLKNLQSGICTWIGDKESWENYPPSPDCYK